MTDLNALREVTDLSTLREGDVIEIRMGDITTRGPVGKVHTGSGGPGWL